MLTRDTYIKKIDVGFKYNPLVVLTGARQVGKTTLMEMFTKNLQCLWLNGQDPETAKLFTSYSTIERFLQLNMNHQLQGWLAIDEFQYIDNISVLLKLLTDRNKDLKILCSGSSSLDILQNVEESLAGRVRVVPVQPLNFSEYLHFTDRQLALGFQQCNLGDDINLLFPKIPALLNEHLTYGGLPKIALAQTQKDKQELLDDIFQTYLLKDVRQYVNNEHFVAFNKLLRLLSASIGNLVNINELANTIQMPRKLCEEYIYLLEQMFIIHLVTPYHQNKRKEISKMNKVYFCDLGLRNIIYNSFNDISIRTDNGQIFENYVYLQLLKQFKASQIQFYRTKDGGEIDFIIQKTGNERILVEAKFKKPVHPKKIRMMTEFAKSDNVHTAYIVNLNLIQQINNQHYIQPYFAGLL